MTGSATPAIAHPPLSGQIEQLDDRIDATPADADALLRRGDLYRREGDFDRARADFAAARAADPARPELDYFEGRLALDAGDPGLADKLLGHYLQRRPEHAAAWMIRGDARLALGRPLEAAGDYGEAVERAARATPALFQLQASALKQAGPDYFDAALDVVDAGLERFGIELSLLGLGTDVALDAGRTQRAQQYFNRVPPAVQALPQWQARAAAIGEGLTATNPDRP